MQNVDFPKIPLLPYGRDTYIVANPLSRCHEVLTARHGPQTRNSAESWTPAREIGDFAAPVKTERGEGPGVGAGILSAEISVFQISNRNFVRTLLLKQGIELTYE